MNARDDPAYELLTTEQAAAAVHVDPKTIQTWVNRGLLEPVGQDDEGRNVFRALDVLIAERRTRRAPRLRALLAAAARALGSTTTQESDESSGGLHD